ncbi:AMP-activated serine/threonine-protein kinase regulatory subunit [Tilletia horrida]|nr:AMP-activated serine/threonine-protein kinase regulatory subunit [Tilletia horrida]
MSSAAPSSSASSTPTDPTVDTPAAASTPAAAAATPIPVPGPEPRPGSSSAAGTGAGPTDYSPQQPAQTPSPHPGSGPAPPKPSDLFVQTSIHSPAWSAGPNTPVSTPAPGKKLKRRPADSHHLPSGSSSVPGTPAIPPTPRRRRPKDRHLASLEAIRDFLRERSSYDVLPVSFRVVVLDTKLVVKPALDVLWQAGIISAPLWHSTVVPPPYSEHEQEGGSAPGDGGGAPAGDDSAVPPLPDSMSPPDSSSGGAATAPTNDLPSSKIKPGFAGMLTVNDIIHLIQYYYKFHASYDIAAKDLEHFRLESLRDIEQALQVPQPPLLSIDPIRPLYQACQLLVKTHARRLPLLDYDETTGVETVVSVLTQYRVLKFIAMNCRETAGLQKSLHSCGIGTYTDTVQIATATLDTTVFDVVHIFSEKGISAVPIVDEEGYVVDMYETVDVITLVRTGAYTALDLTIRQALERRPKDFPGVYTCSPQDSLANLFALLRKVRFHRLLVLEPEDGESGLAVPAGAGGAGAALDTVPENAVAAGATTDEAAEERAATEEIANASVTTPSASELNAGLGLAAPAPAATSGSAALGRSNSHHSSGSSNSASRTNSGNKIGAAPPQALLPQGRTIEEELEAGLRTRKRGRLAGIVCLSDMLRYIVGADEKDLGSALRQATA